METRLQKKLKERRESAALEGITERLSGLFAGEGLQTGAAPAWIDETVQAFWDISKEPVEILSDEAGPEALDAWIEELLTRYGLAGRMYLASHLDVLPWLECQASPDGWMSRVREAIEDPWIFLSESLDVVVAVAEAEYQYAVHVGRSLFPA